MKKIFLLILLILVILFSNLPVFASPFLVSDPNPGATTIILFIDGNNMGDFPAQTDGSIRIDLAQFNLPDGQHIYTAKASNVWGESEISLPFTNIKIVPVLYTGVTLSK